MIVEMSDGFDFYKIRMYCMERIVYGLRIGESPSICPFLKHNGDEAPKGQSPIIFQEWTDTRTFSDFKYISTKIYCILVDIERFLFARALFTCSLLNCPFPVDNGQFDNGKIL